MIQNKNRNTAFVFPGTGIEFGDYEPELYSDNKSLYSQFMETGSKYAGVDLTDAMVSGALDKLDEYQVQVFIYCFSVGTYHVYAEKHLSPGLMAGYSFGIYAALYSVSAISFSTGLEIIDKAYSLMSRAENSGQFGMTAVIGLKLSEIEGIVNKYGLYTARHTNSNNQYCHIFCGKKTEVDMLSTLAADAGAINSVSLAISLPYHHPLFAAKLKLPFAGYLKHCKWEKPECPVISTIDQKIMKTTDELMEFAARHLFSPVNWYKTMECIYNKGYEQMVECGPGISLTQNARFLPKKAKWYNCKNFNKRFKE